MQHSQMKTAIAGAWVLGLTAIALALNVSSASGWMLLGGLGVLPLLTFLRVWREPAPTTSESIREGFK